MVRYAGYLDFPNALTIHACILIADRPIHHFGGTFMPPKGFPTQFDMVVAEDVGLYKFDILSQRGLGKIRDTIDLIAEHQPQVAAQIDIHDMARFKRDPRIQHLLREALAVGCFYVESPAMRMLMRKLRVGNYLGLVAASSVIRPGVSRSGMMRAYIERHRHPERRDEAHPVLLELMPETYGVMVYQEDVIKVAHHSPGSTSVRRMCCAARREREVPVAGGLPKHGTPSTKPSNAGATRCSSKKSGAKWASPGTPLPRATPPRTP